MSDHYDRYNGMDELLGTNLAEVGTDCISRQAAIDAIENAFDRETILNRFVRKIAISAVRMLPPAQPERTPMQELLDVTADRDYWKAQCHSYEMTINRLTESAQPEPYTDALKAEIKRMKRSFTICINSDYYTGYMSALSSVEGYIAQMEVTT